MKRFDETRVPKVSPTDEGRKRFPPYGYYNDEFPCTCKPTCSLTCKGECKCDAHWHMFEDWLKGN